MWSSNDTVKALAERILKSISKEPHNTCVALYIHNLIQCLNKSCMGQPKHYRCFRVSVDCQWRLYNKYLLKYITLIRINDQLCKFMNTVSSIKGTAWGGGSCCHPRHQNPRGDKMNILNEKIIFSVLNQF